MHEVRFMRANRCLQPCIESARMRDHVTLTLELDADDQLRITVADQGVGFDPARLDDRSKSGQVGWGLFRIGDRLTLLGGRLGHRQRAREGDSDPSRRAA
jgi:signal transduction histidine kinase